MSEPKAKKAKPDVEYVAVVGLDYAGPDGKAVRVEADEPALNLPAKSISWLREQNLIREA